MHVPAKVKKRLFGVRVPGLMTAGVGNPVPQNRCQTNAVQYDMRGETNAYDMNG